MPGIYKGSTGDGDGDGDSVFEEMRVQEEEVFVFENGTWTSCPNLFKEE